MNVKDFLEKIEELRKNNPDIEIDNIEIGPVFSGDAIMNVVDIVIIHDSGYDAEMGIIWMC